MIKRKLLLISIIAIAGFLLMLCINVFETFQIIEERRMVREDQPIPFFMYRLRIPVYSLLFSSILLVIATVPLAYYFMSKRLEEKIEKNFKIISQLIKKENHLTKINSKEMNDRHIILRFLSPNERRVVELLIAKNGKVLQSEIAHLQGMTKLKTHRAVKELERKGIISRESYGKTYVVSLTRDVKEVLLK
jgi:predicted transcriptional regulator